MKRLKKLAGLKKKYLFPPEDTDMFRELINFSLFWVESRVASSLRQSKTEMFYWNEMKNGLVVAFICMFMVSELHYSLY